MTIYAYKPHLVSAIRWVKHGDHEEVTPYLTSDVVKNAECLGCGKPYKDHGVIGVPGERYKKVCPETWVVKKGDKVLLLGDKEFNETFERH